MLHKFRNLFRLGTIRLNCHLVKSQLCLLLCVWFTTMDRPLFLLSVTCEFGLWWGASIKLLRFVIVPLLLGIESWLVLFLANLRVRRNWKMNKYKNYQDSLHLPGYVSNGIGILSDLIICPILKDLNIPSPKEQFYWYLAKFL